ncbi:MAG: DegV family protein, partial [Clostridia bacterium]|nr:DegV family protein [Clostridia bacterium]
MANTVRISADSTVDLSPELLERYSITICPLAVTMGDETLNDDGVSVKPPDLFEYTRRTGLLAKTAAQSTDYYENYFKALTEDGSEVIHFTISSGMSSAYTFSCLAAEEVGGVHVVD